MRSFISLEEALELLNDSIESLDIEEVPLLNGLNKVLAESVYSKINNPPFNKSAMDGYALIAEDAFINNKIEVIDKVYAGGFSRKTVTKNTAIKIMTGAPIPEGANVVIKQEDVIIEDNSIVIRKEVSENQNICPIGEDICKGDLLVEANKKLNYSDIGIIASSGIHKIKVYKKPRIAFFSTGDEVSDLNEDLKYGKIYNSNKFSIISRLIELGYEVNKAKHIKDDYIEIGRILKETSKDSDIIITTGGVSVGEKDLLKDAIKSIDGEILFWKITIKPGSAVLCSKVNNCIVISLSGNPTAALTTFELLVKTSLNKMSGEKDVRIIRDKAILADGIIKKDFKHKFLRGYFQIDNCKQKVYITQKKSGNGILRSALNSNCIIEINPNNEELKTGDLVDIIKL
ncbi:MAG: molybdopterin molybdotransferase MoeA [Clostridium sp.]|uniref:molybdopterin molybdotransferase MoeA n=1 Tax=Clostridium sp. TaxID=1506 RepID=UPI0025B98E7C|nr:molybdopterin molybdotransferase MoeA [Clostridium sp.]MCF0148102.1 molybdopterin molybdotransferase MoeA [Clostridium sp.]